MRKNCLHICVLLDVSASMRVIKSRVVCSLRLFLQERLARNEQTKKLDVYVFAGSCEKILSDVDLESLDFERFDEAFNSVLVCQGVTTIQDALCVTIDAFGAKLAALDEDLRPEKVVFVVITDGYDNSSLRFSIEDVKDRISLQTEVYSWRFVFFNAQLYQIYSDCYLNETPSFEPLNAPERVAFLVKGNEKRAERDDADVGIIELEEKNVDETDLKEGAELEKEASVVESDEIDVEIETPESFETIKDELEIEVETVDDSETAEDESELEFFVLSESEAEDEPLDDSETAEDDSDLEFSELPESEVEDEPLDDSETAEDEFELEFSALPESETEVEIVDDADTVEDDSDLEFSELSESEVEDEPLDDADTVEDESDLEFSELHESEVEDELLDDSETAEDESELVFSALPESEADSSDESELEFSALPESEADTSDESELEFSALPESEVDSSDESELEFSELPESETDSFDGSEPLDDETILEDVSFESIASQTFESSENARTKASVFVPLDAFEETSTDSCSTLDEINDESNVDVSCPSVPLEENLDVVCFEATRSDDAYLDKDVAQTDEESDETSDDACLWEDYDVEDIKEPFSILPSSNVFTVKSLDSRLRVREEVVFDVESRDPSVEPPESESSDETNQDVSDSSEEVCQEGDALDEESKSGLVRRFFSVLGNR